MTSLSRPPIRVLHVIAGLDPEAGGPPVALVTTSLALRDRGVLNSIAYVDGSHRAASNAERLVAAGVDTYSFPVTKGTGRLGIRWGISVHLAVWLLRRADRFDVLHTHGAWTFTTVAALVAARLRRRVVVLSAHESLTDFDREKSGPIHSRIKQMLRWFYMRAFDVVVVASGLEQREMRDRPGHRTVVVPHAVMSIPGDSPRQSNGQAFRVGFLGRIHPKKNLELLIDALESLPRRVSLHVAGDGPPAYREMLVSRARARGVDMRIQWLGFVNDAAKREFLASIDVLAMPSMFECFGLAAAEALSAGRPVVVSSQVGMADAVREYRCGRVIDPSAAELARALRELMEDVPTRRLLAINARVAASREFSVREHGERLTAQYEVALGVGTRRKASGA